MFDAKTFNESKFTRYELGRDGAPISRIEVIHLWKSDESFRAFFIQLLSRSPFVAFRWETPAINRENMSQPFEFVLVDSPEFVKRKSDVATFGEYFTADEEDCGVVVFENLRGDATLVVPSPRSDHASYGHLAAFIRNAPDEQVDAFWRITGATLESKVGDKPVWLSTAGGGVAWLHMRLDSRPKYYNYLRYKTCKAS